jgi:hypothetical protein
VDAQEPQIILPGGFKTPSGLYLPTSFGGLRAANIPADLEPQPGLFVVGNPPSFIDQVFAYATQEELGLDPTPADVVVAALREIPFWAAMRVLARYQRDLWPARGARERQLDLLHRWFGETGTFVERGRAFLNASPRNMLFSEQQIFALQKLVTLYSPDGESSEELSDVQYLGLMIALAAVPGTILRTPEFDELAQEEASDMDVTDDRWLQLFVGHGGFIGRGSIKHELGRAHNLYEVIAKSTSARAHQDACPLEEWLCETYGLTFIELQAIAFALHAGSKMQQTEENPVLIDTGYFATTKLADKAQVGLDALSADRAWYQSTFERTSADPRRLAFEITPFLQRPALRHPGGKVMPLAPRALEAWLSASGTYYRLFDISRAKGSATRKRFTRFNGHLVERHAKDVVDAAYKAPVSALLWVAGRVHGEVIYPTPAGEARTPDIAIDLGPDLVLIEVTGGRPTEKSLVDAEPEAIRKDIEKLLEDKIRQLGDRIRDLRVGLAKLPDVDIDGVERIWPIVVSSEGLFQTPTLWEYLRGDALTALDQGSVERLTLLDLEDLERLMGLVEQSHVLVEILRSKTQPGWQERDLASWFESEGEQFGSSESPYALRLSEAAFEMVVKRLFTEAQLTEYLEKVEADG